MGAWGKSLMKAANQTARLEVVTVLVLGCMTWDASVAAPEAGPSLIGPDAIRTSEKELPSICHIQTSFPNSDDLGQCSGTLVSGTEVMTGAHCFGRRFNLNFADVQVRCGGQTTSVVAVALPADRYWFEDSKPTSGYDVAKLTLSTPLAYPMLRASRAENYFDEMGELLPQVQCEIAGFGISRNRDIGTLNRASVGPMRLVYRSGIIKLTHPQGGGLRTSVGYGDSGGALYCRKSQQAPELVGVVVSYRVDPAKRAQVIEENVLAPIWNQAL